MKTVADLPLIPVWLEANHLVSTARIVMLGHHLRALGVTRAGVFDGAVTLDRTATAPEGARIESILEHEVAVIESGTSIRKAADRFLNEGFDFAAVARGDEFLGILTAHLLLKELSQSNDAITNLPWSDLLREWGVDTLAKGLEITILFLDLDEFGQFNKRYGHVVGDEVLKRTAAMLVESIDEDRDVLVRYGGDEFAIGTVRTRSEAEDLAERLQRKGRELYVAEHAEPVSFSIGVFGGKRTKERENAHYAATLDNLINNASKAALANKRLRLDSAPKDKAPELVAKSTRAPSAPRMAKVVEVFADDAAPNSMTQVLLSVGESVVSGVSARMGGSILDSVATATAKALERGFPGVAFRVEDIRLSEDAEGRRIVTVSGQLQEGGKSIPAGGAMTVNGALYVSVADATVKAFLTAR